MAVFRNQPADEWFSVVFHVLAHLDVGPLPASVYDPAYVADAAAQCGSVERRELVDGVEALGRLVSSQRQLLQLQRVAWLFRTVEQAQASAELDLAELTSDRVAAPELLPVLRQAVTAVELLVCSALLEVNAFRNIEPRPLDEDSLLQAMAKVEPAAPQLREFSLYYCDALGAHGLVSGHRIWLGTPGEPVGASPEYIAWQAAHLATFSEVVREARDQPEPANQARAAKRLRQRAEAAGLKAPHGRWFSEYQARRTV